MKLVRWDPFQELVTINHRLGRTWGESFPVDIYEKDDALVVKAELPGVGKEDLDVRVEDGVLTLQAERKRGTEVSEESSYRMERVYGSFTRSFTLPTTVDASKVAATYKDGVLEVTVPKAETAKPKKVEIRAA